MARITDKGGTNALTKVAPMSEVLALVLATVIVVVVAVKMVLVVVVTVEGILIFEGGT